MLVVVGLAIFHLWGGNLSRAVGVAVILFAVGGLLVDHTSEHNARTYHAEILGALDSSGSPREQSATRGRSVRA